MTELQKKALEAYEKLFVNKNKVSIRDLAIELYGESNNNTRIKSQSLVRIMKAHKEWPENYTFIDSRGQYDREAVNRINGEAIKELDEIDILKRIADLLSSLKLESMMKVLTFIKEQRFTFDEITVLKEVGKLFDALDESSEERILDYIRSRFKL
jgi:hypothetical protein